MKNESIQVDKKILERSSWDKNEAWSAVISDVLLRKDNAILLRLASYLLMCIETVVDVRIFVGELGCQIP